MPSCFCSQSCHGFTKGVFKLWPACQLHPDGDSNLDHEPVNWLLPWILEALQGLEVTCWLLLTDSPWLCRAFGMRHRDKLQHLSWWPHTQDGSRLSKRTPGQNIWVSQPYHILWAGFIVVQEAEFVSVPSHLRHTPLGKTYSRDQFC